MSAENMDGFFGAQLPSINDANVFQWLESDCISVARHPSNN